MCGIAGVVALREELEPVGLEPLARMAGALRHRGPEETGAYRDARAGLAHARLSIIDLATGQQPLSNEDGSLWIAFNGEIFNYVELREELVSLGHRFRTRSDTEVILHAYEARGQECVQDFNGQWALALWDSRRRRLFLSRDRLGVRPLYYTLVGNRFLFALPAWGGQPADNSATVQNERRILHEAAIREPLVSRQVRHFYARSGQRLAILPMLRGCQY